MRGGIRWDSGAARNSHRSREVEDDDGRKQGCRKRERKK